MCGSITNAIQRARQANAHLFLVVEVQDLTELAEAMHAKPDRILLDNFNLAQIQAAVTLNTQHDCPLEVSGGINLANVANIAATGVQFISVGDLTKSVRAIDLSLLVL